MEYTALLNEDKAMLAEIKGLISVMRKERFDIFIPSLHIINIPSKIRFAELTDRKEDMQKIREELIFVKKELEEIRRNNDLLPDL